MRNKLFILFLILIIPQVVSSQELNLYRRYVLNNFYQINPASAGYDGEFISKLNYSQQWLGLADAPSIQTFSTSVRLGNKDFYNPKMYVNRPIFNINERVGLGLSFFNERNGPLRHTGIMLAYAYHIPLRYKTLSFGISGTGTQYYLNNNQFKPIDSNDPGLLFSENKAVVPNINIGSMLYNQKYFLGVSVNELLNSNHQITKNKTRPNFVLCGGYRYHLKSYFDIEPSLFLLKYNQDNLKLDINAKLYFRELNYLILSYRSSKEILAGIGLHIQDGIQIAYAYNVTIGGLSTYSYGNHEFMVLFSFSELLR